MAGFLNEYPVMRPFLGWRRHSPALLALLVFAASASSY